MNSRKYYAFGLLQLLLGFCNSSQLFAKDLSKSLEYTPIIWLGVRLEYWLLCLCVIAFIISVGILLLCWMKSGKKSSADEISGRPEKIAGLLEETKRHDDLILTLSKKIKDLQSQVNKLQEKIAVNAESGKEVGVSDELPKSALKVEEKETDSYAKPEIGLGHSFQYIWLKAIDGGKLKLTSGPDSAIYRAWKKDGILFFEFSCQRAKRAINNRTSLIDPFCEVQANSLNPDLAQEVVVQKVGTLSEDYSVITKVLIKYN